MHDLIREIEHVTLRSWPALESENYDGWILRFSHGYTGRANSANPLDSSSLPLEEKISYCENWYAERGLKTIFRLNIAVHPPELDSVLEQREYYNETIVQVANLREFSAETDAPFHYESIVSDAWLADWGNWNNAPGEHISTAKTMLETIEGAACFGRIGEAALGLAVVENSHVGLFDIVVRDAYRRQGMGLALVTSLLSWAKSQGADTAYLQVTASNHPAIALYEQLGFAEHHRYWYRRK
jgi:GNAT superfamily N-acetyltransferase